MPSLPPVYTFKLAELVNVGVGGPYLVSNDATPAVNWIVHDIYVRLVNNDFPVIAGLHLITSDAEDLSFECPAGTAKSFHINGQRVLESGQSFFINVEGGGATLATITFHGAALTLP